MLYRRPSDRSLARCPDHLLPDVLVSYDEESLSVSDMGIRQFLRSHLSAEEILAQLNQLSDLGAQRHAHGDRASMALFHARAFYDAGAPLHLNDWMHPHEAHRLHQLRLALPTVTEEAEAARQRIAARVHARRGQAADYPRGGLVQPALRLPINC